MPRIRTAALTALLSGLLAAPAFALGAGGSLLALQLISGEGDFVSPEGAYLSAYTHGELGAGGEYWYQVTDGFAIAVAGRYARSRELQSATNRADRLYRQTSWSARVGGDRVVEIGDRSVIYFGPGIEYWRGHSQFLGIFGTVPPLLDVTTPEVTRWSVSGRIGAIFVLGPSWGLAGHLGHRAGRASASQDGAKTTWYTNGFEGSGGLVFAFGGGD